MPIPIEPMDSIALDLFYYPSTSHDGGQYDLMHLCVCRLSGYLIALPIPKSRHKDKNEGRTGKAAARLMTDLWVDRFGVPRDICSSRGPQFMSQYFRTLCSKIGARSTMCLAGRHQGNGKAENTSRHGNRLHTATGFSSKCGGRVALKIRIQRTPLKAFTPLQ